MTPFPEAVYGGCCLWGCSQKPAWCQQRVSNAATELEARKSKSLWAGKRFGGGWSSGMAQLKSVAPVEPLLAASLQFRNITAPMTMTLNHPT